MSLYIDCPFGESVDYPCLRFRSEVLEAIDTSNLNLHYPNSRPGDVKTSYMSLSK